MAVFGKAYADVYDAIYEDKPYAQEVAVVQSLARRFTDYCTPDSTSVLDLGCGTGRHAAIWCQNGHQVVGVDASHHMLEVARMNVPAGEFIHAGIADLRLDRRFGIVTMMSAVLGYQHLNKAVLDSLRVARNLLEDDGILVFDVWYGPTVLTNGPSERIKQTKNYLRYAKPRMLDANNLCEVQYKIWELGGGSTCLEETHLVRYFFQPEIILFLQLAGFAALQIGECPDIDIRPELGSWHMMVAARPAQFI